MRKKKQFSQRRGHFLDSWARIQTRKSSHFSVVSNGHTYIKVRQDHIESRFSRGLATKYRKRVGATVRPTTKFVQLTQDHYHIIVNTVPHMNKTEKSNHMRRTPRLFIVCRWDCIVSLFRIQRLRNNKDHSVGSATHGSSACAFDSCSHSVAWSRLTLLQYRGSL